MCEFQVMENIFEIGITLAVFAVGTWISVLQYKLARFNSFTSLFEVRYTAYSSLIKSIEGRLSEISSYTDVSECEKKNEKLKEFWQSSRRAKLLFSLEFSEHIDAVQKDLKTLLVEKGNMIEHKSRENHKEFLKSFEEYNSITNKMYFTHLDNLTDEAKKFIDLSRLNEGFMQKIIFRFKRN